MGTQRRRRRAGYLGSAAAVTATAVVGALAIDPDSDWYRSLRKPNWQPPSQAFGLVWTPLYAAIACASGRALDRVPDSDRPAYVRSVGANLILNAGWNWLFFKARSPLAGLVGIGALNVSNVKLIEKTAKIDKSAAVALTPYAVWCGFATALNADILRRNGDR